MKDFDLNIFPVYYAKQSTYDAILSLVNNNYASTSPLNNHHTLTIEYEPSSQTLKFTLHQWDMHVEYFIQQETSGLNFPFTLLEATAILTSQGMYLTFESKFGTFIPYLKQKEGIDIPMACLYLHYEPKIQHKDYADLKNLFNDNDPNLTDTTITIAPISFKLVTTISNHLSWFQDWKQIIKSRNGYLLIANSNHPNTVYLNGLDLRDEITSQVSSFLYSYDLDATLIDEPNDDSLEKYLNQILCLILDGLDEQDKKKIYPTLLNNEHAKEWTFSNVQILILKYLNKLNPDQYVIYANDDYLYADYLQLAVNEHKTIIKVNKDAFSSLRNEIDSIYVFALKWMSNNLVNEYANDDLDFNEQNNFNTLLQFMDYFKNHYEWFKQSLFKDKLNQLRWGIYENYPLDEGTYSWRLGGCIIARSSLRDLPTLFNTACDAVWRYITDISYKDFRNAWLANTINFLNSYHVKKQDWNQSPTKQELKNQNKEWS